MFTNEENLQLVIQVLAEDIRYKNYKIAELEKKIKELEKNYLRKLEIIND